MTSVSGQLTLSTIGAVERSARNPGAEALRCRRHRMGRTDVRARTDAAGFKAHLVKPIDYDAVRKIVAYLLAAWSDRMVSVTSPVCSDP